ncbi:hypothetical protein Vadar_025336 [Vaccinium darrowii]|uniref:Uncharacterized protein n=1 Tax=Vaccinium darrowii TaxID=229202 RepID=A0ACB7XTR8_9ERIC|nr:hypothetical protein Vadar_025336 [Vaccinium darrowii]
MTTLLQVSINLSPFNALRLHEDRIERQRCCGLRLSEPICCPSVLRSKIGFLHQKRFKLGVCRERWSFLEVRKDRDGILVKKRVVLVKSNQGFRFNGGGGGGGRGNGRTARILGNLALVIGLTYLSLTGQIGLVFDAIGWVFDVVVSLSILAVILPIAGLGALLWWAGRDIVQDSCPNCGNDFKVFRSAMNNDLQLCPFCSQPFSVVGNKFVSDPVNFSNKSTNFGEAFKNFSSRSSKGKDFSSAVVDVEAEVKDLD